MVTERWRDKTDFSLESKLKDPNENELKMVLFYFIVIKVDVEQSYIRFLGNLVLNLWDCGGQEAFMEHYFTAQRDNIFRNVEVLIYVFDAESREIDKDIHYYQSW